MLRNLVMVAQQGNEMDMEHKENEVRVGVLE